MDDLPRRQVAGVYYRRVGEITVTVLHDGHQDVSMTTVRDIAADEAARLLHDAFRPVPRRTAVNTFLIRGGGRVALVDTGYGPDVRPTVGFMAANLAAAGLAPADVDTVLLTHLHPDHSGGLLTRDGTPLFPAAEVLLHADELAYWHDDAAMLSMADPASRQRFFGGARAAIAAYRGRVRTFNGGEVFPGVAAVPLPGHTPGHTGFEVASAGSSLLIWGDIVHVQEIQVPRPEATMAVDVEPARSVLTRRKIFDRVAREQLAVAGMHLHFPALAHLARHGDGYVLVPDAWTMAMEGDAPGST